MMFQSLLDLLLVYQNVLDMTFQSLLDLLLVYQNVLDMMFQSLLDLAYDSLFIIFGSFSNNNTNLTLPFIRNYSI